MSAERLEKRDLFSGDDATFLGVGSLTYSFAPDGTHVGRQVNQLHTKFDQVAQSSVWQQSFARAFQKWSAVANINFGEVEDNGAATGIYGPTRGDERFGDIRITGFDFATDTSAEAVTENTRAVGTWAGDVVFNTKIDWQSPDRIEAAALHEIGHILGLGHSTDPASPMFVHGPSGAIELTQQDISNVQAIHGPRGLDSNEGSNGNDTISRASRIKGGEGDTSVLEGFRGDQVWIQFGDLHNANDRDVYEVRTAVGFTGPIAVEVRSAGLSLAELSVEISDRDGNVLTRADMANGVATVTLNSTISDGRYYLHVHATAEPFWSTGDYSITIADPSTLGLRRADIAAFSRNAHRWYFDSHQLKDGFSWKKEFTRESQPETNDNHADDSFSSSVVIPVVLSTNSQTIYRVVGTLSDLVDIDNYRLDAPDVLNGHTEMTVSLESLGVAGLVPNIQVLDSQGLLVRSELRVKGYGQTELVVKNVQAKQRFIVRLDAANVSNEFRTGSFSLHVSFAAPSNPPEVLDSGILDQDHKTVEHEWYIARPQLIGLSLEGLVGSASADGQIWISIFDQQRHFVTGLVTPWNDLRTAPGVFLDAGTYFFQIATSQSPLVNTSVAYRFIVERPSNPIGVLLGPVNVQPLFLCPGSTSVYCYPNTNTPTVDTIQVGPPPTVALPVPSTKPVVPALDKWFWTNAFFGTNPTNALDANGDGRLDPLDVLVIINYINAKGIGPIPTPPESVGYLDTNASGTIDPLDVLIVINALNRNG